MGDIRTADGEEIAEDGGPIGLALSGGGLKAALFHVGVLARLAELDLLRRIDVISATGGGAVTAALYFLHLKQALDRDGDIDSQRLVQMVAVLESGLLELAGTDLQTRLFDNPFANLKRASARHSSAARLGDLLDRHAFRPIWSGDPKQPVAMRDLVIQPRGDKDFNPASDNPKRYCKAPSLILNATDLTTAQPWRFDAERMGVPAPSPSARRLSAASLLAETPYRRLPDAHAGIGLGHAVAACLATPGLIEPLRIRGLYPDPGRPSAFLDIELADGRLSDALATDALIARGCGRLIVSEASGFEDLGGSAGRPRRACQLDRLEAAPASDVVLVPMLSEIVGPEITPAGPLGRGHIASDRSVKETTSYGVERRVQTLIADARAGLDAPSEIEAMALMADGYLIAKRAFQRHGHRGKSWTDSLPTNAEIWRFAAVFEALRLPSRAQVRHLTAAKLGPFDSGRLLFGQTVTIAVLTVAATLSLVALAAFWTALRPESGADRLWILATIGLVAIAAWLAGRQARHGKAPRSWMGKVMAVVNALPLAVGAGFRHRASRAFLKAGRIEALGIKPIKTEKPAKDAVRLRKRQPETPAVKEAA